MKPLNIKPYDKFNKLTFLEETEPKYKGFMKLTMGMFECECGKTKIMIVNNVLHGLSKSCGCSRKESKYNINRKKCLI